MQSWNINRSVLETRGGKKLNTVQLNSPSFSSTHKAMVNAVMVRGPVVGEKLWEIVCCIFVVFMLLLPCVHARGHEFNLGNSLSAMRPASSTASLSAWWCAAIKSVPNEHRKGLNSLIILVTWEILKDRNACVSKGAQPSVQRPLQTVSSECVLWCLAGASKL